MRLNRAVSPMPWLPMHPAPLMGALASVRSVHTRRGDRCVGSLPSARFRPPPLRATPVRGRAKLRCGRAVRGSCSRSPDRGAAGGDRTFYASASQARSDRSSCWRSAAAKLPIGLITSRSSMVKRPRFTADGTFSPAPAQSVRMNSPESSPLVRLVNGTTKRSREGCGALTTTAGRTLALEASENG